MFISVKLTQSQVGSSPCYTSYNRKIPFSILVSYPPRLWYFTLTYVIDRIFLCKSLCPSRTIYQWNWTTHNWRLINELETLEVKEIFLLLSLIFTMSLDRFGKKQTNESKGNFLHHSLRRSLSRTQDSLLYRKLTWFEIKVRRENRSPLHCSGFVFFLPCPTHRDLI